MDSSVKPISYVRGKLKLFKSRQAVFLYVLMFYLTFMFLQRPTFVPGAEFSSNKESLSDPTIEKSSIIRVKEKMAIFSYVNASWITRQSPSTQLT